MFVAFGMPGMSEWLIILVIVIIFFGVGKLPAVLGQMGKGVKAFKDGVNNPDDEENQIDITPDVAQSTKVKDAEELDV